MPGESEVRFDSRLQCSQPKLVEPRGLHLRERLVGDVHEHGPSRERERFTKRPGRRLGIARRLLAPTPGDEPLEAVEVELVWLDPEPVAGALRRDPILPEALAKSVDLHLQRVGGARGRTLAPDRVDQPVARDDLVPVEEEAVEHPRLPAGAERDDATVVDDLERSKKPELDRWPSSPAAVRAYSGS